VGLTGNSEGPSKLNEAKAQFLKNFKINAEARQCVMEHYK